VPWGGGRVTRTTLKKQDFGNERNSQASKDACWIGKVLNKGNHESMKKEEKRVSEEDTEPDVRNFTRQSDSRSALTVAIKICRRNRTKRVARREEKTQRRGIKRRGRPKASGGGTETERVQVPPPHAQPPK